MDAYTDYPFTDFGDVAGKAAPVRAIKVLSYDGDKYVTVTVTEPGYYNPKYTTEIKAGYVYANRASYDFAEKVPLALIEELPLTY